MNHKLLAFLALVIVLALSACGRATVEGLPVAAAAIDPGPSATQQAPSDAPASPPSPTATTLPPTQEPAVAPSALPVIQLMKLPAAGCCRGRTLEPGYYAAPAWLGIPLALAPGEGWRVLNEERAQLFLLGRGENAHGSPSRIITFIDATGPAASPESIIAAAQGISQLTPLGEPVSVAIAGFPGWQLDSVAKPNPDEKGDPSADIPPGVQYLPFFQKYFAPGFLWTTFTPEARVRTAVVRVGERTMLLYIEAPAAEFEQFIADVDVLLWTLRIAPNGPIAD